MARDYPDPQKQLVLVAPTVSGESNGQPFESFQEYLVTPQPHGLGITKEHIEKIKRIRELLDKTGLKLLGVRPSKGATGPPKGNQNAKKKGEESENNCATGTIVFQEGHGSNSHAYRASRMARDYPEMFAKVARGEITLLDAERELGIAREDRRISLPDDPAKARERIIAKFGQDSFASWQEAQEPAALRTRRADMASPVLKSLPRNPKIPPTAPLADGRLAEFAKRASPWQPSH